MSKQDQSGRALSLEWMAARVIVIGGIVVAVAAVLYFGWIKPTWLTAPQVAPEVQQAKAEAQAELDLCTTGIKTAQSFGIIPPYAKLAQPLIQKTDVSRRYACFAQTPATKYVMAVDLVCRNLKDGRCVSLYSVSQADGTVLYQRQS